MPYETQPLPFDPKSINGISRGCFSGSAVSRGRCLVEPRG
jgi:hypothetical protein